MSNLKQIASKLASLNPEIPAKKDARTKHVAILVGAPCTGKSTYIENIAHDFVVSSDTIVEQVCDENNLSYAQFFKLGFYHPLRKKQRYLFNCSIEESKQHRRVIWDLTNLTEADRKRAMKHYPNAEFQAFVFEFQGFEDQIIKMVEQRGISEGKVIPESAVRGMFDKFEPVNKSEGFSAVWPVDTMPHIVPFDLSELSDEQLTNFKKLVDNASSIEFNDNICLLNIDGHKNDVHQYLEQLDMLLSSFGLGVIDVEDISDFMIEEDMVDYLVTTNLPACKFEKLVSA